MKHSRRGLVCTLSVAGWVGLLTGHWIVASFLFLGATILEFSKRA